MALVLTIGGSNKTSLLKTKSLRFTREIASRNTCRFVLIDPTVSYRPAHGAAVSVTDGATTHFAGTIIGVSETHHFTAGLRTLNVQCADYNQYADRRRVAEVYDNRTVGYIADHLISNYLADDGITTPGSLAASGPSITKITFNYVTLADALSELASIAGWVWNIGYDKVLSFGSRTSYLAAFDLTDSNKAFLESSLQKTTSTGQYRNRQYILGGYGVTSDRTESFVGDGTRKAFTLSFPVGGAPSVVTVNAVSKTIGIKGVDTGKDWYWSPGDPVIPQDDGGTALTSGQTLAVTYKGKYPLLQSAQDDTEILARVAAEGGSGIWEAVYSDPNIDRDSLATDVALGLITRYRIPEIIEYTTDTPGLEENRLQTINLTDYGINGTYLIEKVEGNDWTGHNIRYDVRALSGEGVGGWESFFRSLVSSGQKFLIRDDEVIVQLRNFSEQVRLTDSLDYVSAAPESRVGYALVDESEAA